MPQPTPPPLSRPLLERLLRFGLMSVSSFVLNFGVTIGLHELLKAPEELAFAVALLSALALNFFLMRHYVYEAESRSPRRQAAIYLPAAFGFRASEYLAFLGLHTLGQLDYRITMLVVLSTSAIAKFVFYRWAFTRG